MLHRIEVLIEESRAYAAARARAMDRSTWKATWIEAIALACAVAVFAASALDAPPARVAGQVDSPVPQVSPAR
jgi:hypothetical protein